MRLRDLVNAYERRLVCEALTTTRGDVRAAARLLGEGERRLWRRLAVLSIDVRGFRPSAANPASHQ